MVTIALTGGRTRFTLADGKTREVNAMAGQVTWSAPEKHSPESLSDKPEEVKRPVRVLREGSPRLPRPRAWLIVPLLEER